MFNEVNEVEYPMSVLVKYDGEIDTELSTSLEKDILLSFGVVFCPKCFYGQNPDVETNEEISTFDIDDDNNGSGICFEIFNKLFEKLKERDLVQRYELDELECTITAEHENYPFLKRMDSITTVTHYGIGFNLGKIPKIGWFTEEDISYLRNVIEILKDIQPEYPILQNQNFELQYHLLCQFNND